ncbi:MAG: BsuPI-related putative proteinase inhibitor [Bacillota bacterium]
MYRTVVLVFVFLFVFSLGAGAEEDINHLNVNLHEVDGIKMASLRSLSDKMDWGVEFLPEKKSVRLTGGEAILELEVGSDELFGRELEYAPVIEEGRVYISLEDVEILLDEMKVEDPPQIFADMTLDSLEFEKGDVLSGTMVLYNITDEDITLEFSSGQNYDLLLYREGRQIWQWSSDRMFTMALQTKQLPAGESLEFEFEFESEEDLEPGTYELRGVITSHSEIEAGSVGIEVK